MCMDCVRAYMLALGAVVSCTFFLGSSFNQTIVLADETSFNKKIDFEDYSSSNKTIDLSDETAFNKKIDFEAGSSFNQTLDFADETSFNNTKDFADESSFNTTKYFVEATIVNKTTDFLDETTFSKAIDFADETKTPWLIPHTNETDESGIMLSEDVDIKSYSFMAFLRRTYNYYDRKVTKIQYSKCDATILPNNHVLTAAHCIADCNSCGDRKCPNCEKYDIQSYNLIAGTAEVTKEQIPFQSKIKKVHIHPKYGQGCNRGNDIAIVELNKRMKFSPRIKAVTLPPPVELGQAYNSTKACTIVGWVEAPSFLKHQTANILTNHECDLRICQKSDICSNTYPQDNKYPMKETCLGVGGKALMCGGVQIGVASNGDSLCRIPVVYSRVGVYIQWIEEIIKHK